MATLIDQILPVVAPSRSVADQPRATSSDGTRFQEHLERASSVEKPASASESQEDPASEEDNGLALTAEQDQDGSLDKNEVVSPPVEGDESNEPIPDVIESIVATDDILLSSAAIIAAGESETEIETSTEIESVPAVQSATSEENLGQGTETTPLPIEATVETATGGILTDEVVAKIEQESVSTSGKEQNPNADSTNQAELVTTSVATDEVLLADKPQQNAQASQSEGSAETSGPGTTDLPSQSETGNGAFQQSPGFDEVEPDEANREPTSESDKKAASAPVNPLETLSRESMTINADAEPVAAANATPVEANANTNTSSESTLVIEKSSNTPSLDPTTATADSRTEADVVSTVDRARFVQRVSGAIRSANDQDGLIQLKLSPPELGSLRIEISVKQGILTAKLETETAAARAVLLDNLPALRERLAEQEIRIEKFDVDVRNESKQQENASTEDRNSNNSRSDKANSRTPNQSEEQSNTPTPTNLGQASSDLSGGLDVMV
ncbi:MAG: hypothetical protein GXP26_13655 [Planctomycetes bacterium]|nr:hypothetical protein [Planctomycetota bacterium]